MRKGGLEMVGGAFDRLDARAGEATPAPWSVVPWREADGRRTHRVFSGHVGRDIGGRYHPQGPWVATCENESDATFAALARTALPLLTAALRDAEAIAAELAALDGAAWPDDHPAKAVWLRATARAAATRAAEVRDRTRGYALVGPLPPPELPHYAAVASRRLAGA